MEEEEDSCNSAITASESFVPVLTVRHLFAATSITRQTQFIKTSSKSAENLVLATGLKHLIKSKVYFFFTMGQQRLQARVSSLSRYHDHTQTHHTR